VRHKLVQQIVKAYEAFSNRNGDHALPARPARGDVALPRRTP
jgi:hypothetical protein